MNTAIFYIGRAFQLMGIGLAMMSLILYGADENGMGPMMKMAGVGVAEFYAGYALVAFTGDK